MLNKSKNNLGDEIDIHENDIDANLGERAKGKDRNQKPSRRRYYCRLELKKGNS